MIDFPNNRQSIDEVESFWSAQQGIDHFVAKPFVSWDGKGQKMSTCWSTPTGSPRPTQDKVLCDFPWEK